MPNSDLTCFTAHVAVTPISCDTNMVFFTHIYFITYLHVYTDAHTKRKRVNECKTRKCAAIGNIMVEFQGRELFRIGVTRRRYIFRFFVACSAQWQCQRPRKLWDKAFCSMYCTSHLLMKHTDSISQH